LDVKKEKNKIVPFVVKPEGKGKSTKRKKERHHLKRKK
jgi:hypothetical protein